MMKLAELSKKLKDLYKSQDTLPKLIEDSSVPEQKMAEYYVKLQIAMEDKGAAEERLPIDLENIFDPAGNQGAVGKTLIHGVAGVDKSTLIQHIVYKRAENVLFATKFHYVFKIRLTSLSDKSLRHELETYDDDDDKLSVTDCVSKLMMNLMPVEFKENYLEPVIEVCQEITNAAYDIIGKCCDYFNPQEL